MAGRPVLDDKHGNQTKLIKKITSILNKFHTGVMEVKQTHPVGTRETTDARCRGRPASTRQFSKKTFFGNPLTRKPFLRRLLLPSPSLLFARFAVSSLLVPFPPSPFSNQTSSLIQLVRLTLEPNLFTNFTG